MLRQIMTVQIQTETKYNGSMACNSDAGIVTENVVVEIPGKNGTL